jgi:hypothetical protein
MVSEWGHTSVSIWSSSRSCSRFRLSITRARSTSGTDDGKFMPAYSRFIGAYGAAYIARTWYPPQYQTFMSGFKAGSESLGFDVATNLLREFWPDIKKRFHK